MRRESVKIRVLLAEEDPVQRLILREYLDMDGRYEVSEPESIRQLLELGESGRFGDAILLLDLKWSRMGRVDVIRDTRKRNPGIRILGLADRNDRIPEITSPGSLYKGILYKPFPPSRLHRRMAAMLSQPIRKEVRIATRTAVPG